MPKVKCTEVSPTIPTVETPQAKDAASTRQRIFDAARAQFSQRPYDAVGLREIALQAGVDAALVIRYFGSKEELLREVVADAFDPVELLQDGIAKLPQRAVQLLLPEPQTNASVTHKSDVAYGLLLCSLGSPIAQPIVVAAWETSCLQPIIRTMKGSAAEVRALTLQGCLLGFVAMLRVVPERTSDPRRQRMLRRHLQAVLEASLAILQ